jgi:hypothetical protein
MCFNELVYSTVYEFSQSLIEMSTRNISWVLKAAGA